MYTTMARQIVIHAPEEQEEAVPECSPLDGCASGPEQWTQIEGKIDEL